MFFKGLMKQNDEKGLREQIYKIYSFIQTVWR